MATANALFDHEEIIQKIVDIKHHTAWLEPSTQDPRETLGLVIAGFCHWSPEYIAMAFLAALEDANAHAECTFIREYLEKEGYELKPVPQSQNQTT